MSNYLPSKYNLIFKAEGGGALLLNTCTGAILKINSQKLNEVNDCLNGRDDGHAEMADVLKSHGFLCDAAVDETERVKGVKLKAVQDETKRMDLIILTTLKCNFACKYCYEQRRDESINAQVAERINQYLERVLRQYEQVCVYWYGGEPLCNFDAISNIMGHLNGLNKTYRRVITSGITTNGYLLNLYENKIRELGINNFQITIDGNEAHHNLNRPLANGEPTFRRIVDNIKSLLKYAENKIVLRVNFNSENLSATRELLDEFKDIENKNQIILSLEPIFGDSALACNAGEGNISKEVIEVYNAAERMGFCTLAKDMFTLRPHKAVYCYAAKKSQLAIAPNGDVFKCTGSDFSKRHSCGFLDGRGNIVFNDKYDEWLKKCTTVPDICEECRYLPLCMCGCVNNFDILINKKDNCKIAQSMEERIRSILEARNLL